ncbi:MAG: hypothetical protein Q9159_005423 [Coniocarpon cinnabarinum]
MPARKSHRDAISPPATPVRKSARASRNASAATVVTEETVEINETPEAEKVTRSGKRKRAAISYNEDSSAEAAHEHVETPAKKNTKSPRRSKAIKTTATKLEAGLEDSDSKSAPAQNTKKSAAKAKADPAPVTEITTETIEIAGPVDEANAATTTKSKPKRKSKAEKEAEMIPLAARTNPTVRHIGAHVSAAGGVQQTVLNAQHIGANAFACFLKSQRKWANPPLKDEHAAAFIAGCQEKQYEQGKYTVPHGSYLVNLATPDPDKAKQAYDSFLDDLKRCDTLGIRLYNFHPGNTNGETRSEAIARLAAQLNSAHKETQSVVTLLENMAAAGEANTIGGIFSELAAVIALVEDKSRVGVCLDTCHAFAAGYDLRSPTAYAQTMKTFDETIGFRYLRAVHLNDSKGMFDSHRDLHQNIGLGFIGLRGFWNLMNDDRFRDVPMVLETPIDTKDEKGKDVEDKSVWAREIKLLESLVGMDVESPEFLAMEHELAAKGAAEREKLRAQFEKKVNSPRKKKKGKKVETDDEGSE